MTFDLLKDLNEQQQVAIKHIDGPLLIMAGAGSGKTRTLTTRIAYMVQEKNVNPWNILAVTFTNKAANEMKQRLLRLFHPELNEQQINARSETQHSDMPLLGTFHAICVRILRKEIHHLNFENDFTIYDDADQLALVKEQMRSLTISEQKINPRAIGNAISAAKNDLVPPDQYFQFVNNYFTEKVAQVYQEYQKTLARNQALDFDDLIMKTIELFEQEAAILAKYQERFRFISVDEYQDTNHAQYILVKHLASKYRNLCVIGDSDQSIYSWRGANIGNILNFEKDYPDAKIILLEQNYRSTKNILDAAHQIIIQNQKRKEKKLWTSRESGCKIRIWTADNERSEGQLLANEIKEKIRSEEYPDYSKFVILYRTNAQSRVLEEIFMKTGIPYKIVGGVKFYSRKEIKDILSYLRLVQNPRDDVSLLRIINTPPRNIGPRTIEILQKQSAHLGLSIFEIINKTNIAENLPAAKIKSLQEFRRQFQDLAAANQKFAAPGVIKAIIHHTGYRNFLLEDGSEEGEIRFQNVQELISVANKYSGLEPGISLATFLEEVALITDLDQVDEKENAVTMMTLHAAKGLEFPCVFIVGLEEGVFPHSRSLFEKSEMEEERRLMYVGMTRAMDHLYLIHARERQLYGEYRRNAPSQFLDLIPEELIDSNMIKKIDLSNITNFKPIPFENLANKNELKDGDKVLHETFGEGIVINISGGVIVIAFKNRCHGIKKFALSVAPLTKIT